PTAGVLDNRDHPRAEGISAFPTRQRATATEGPRLSILSCVRLAYLALHRNRTPTATCATGATAAPLASCRAPIVSHECRCVRFCRRGAGLARCAHRVPTPSRAWPIGRPAGRWAYGPPARRAHTP